jgi:hypothetical protein
MVFQPCGKETMRWIPKGVDQAYQIERFKDLFCVGHRIQILMDWGQILMDWGQILMGRFKCLWTVSNTDGPFQILMDRFKY